MVQNQVLDAEGFCNFTGVLNGGMVFFIGGEYVCLGIQAKGFVHQPLAVFCIVFLTGAVGFIPTASQFFPMPQFHTEAKLFFFCGLYVKKCYLPSKEPLLFPVCHRDEMKMGFDGFPLLFDKQFLQ